MFLNNWKDQDGMKGDFWPNYESYKYAGELDGANVLLASYDTSSYESYAFVLFERGGKLYEVNGSHCSCYGLEGQWAPEETTVAALRHRLENGQLGASYPQTADDYRNLFAAELRQVLDYYEGE